MKHIARSLRRFITTHTNVYVMIISILFSFLLFSEFGMMLLGSLFFDSRTLLLGVALIIAFITLSPGFVLTIYLLGPIAEYIHGNLFVGQNSLQTKALFILTFLLMLAVNAIYYRILTVVILNGVGSTVSLRKLFLTIFVLIGIVWVLWYAPYAGITIALLIVGLTFIKRKIQGK